MKNFDNYQVLVTRPSEQADHFSQMIEEKGAKVINLPTIEIAASDLNEQDQGILKDLSQINIAIFISLNAVKFALQAFKKAKLCFPENIIVAAVGPTTAKILQENKIQVDIMPEENFSSRGLLAMPELEEVGGENILIFRGEEGSELLIEELIKRHANVLSIDCYRRVIPKNDLSKVIKALKVGKLDAVTVTSVTSVDNLFSMLNKHTEQLATVRFVAASARIATACEFYNVTKISVADNAGDIAMLEALLELANRTDLPDEDDEIDEQYDS